jgi:hypothetical protein
MPRPPGKKKRTAAPPPKDDPALPPLDPLRTGMPAFDSITEVREYKKGRRVYRVIKTTERDAYDQDEPAPPKRKRNP